MWLLLVEELGKERKGGGPIYFYFEKSGGEGREGEKKGTKKGKREENEGGW